MNRLLSLTLILLLPAFIFGQAKKNALLKEHLNQLHERMLFMNYTDSIARNYAFRATADIAALDKDFKTLYAGFVAGNPTSYDIAAYIGFDKGQVPQSLSVFAAGVFEANVKEILRLTKAYGYLSGTRTGFKGFTPIQFALRSSGLYEEKLAEIFKEEYKKKNMPESEYVFFTTLKNSNGVLTDADIARMEEAGMKLIKRQ
jgi:hypothetical protein